jgi:hypothetical protein
VVVLRKDKEDPARYFCGRVMEPDDPLVYDNDAETLLNDKQMLQEWLTRVSPDIRIVALRGNSGESLDPHRGDTAEQEEEEKRLNYFVLNKKSLDYEEALRERLGRDDTTIPKRFSLVAMNHKFRARHGTECLYDTEEMTLAFVRVACRVSSRRSICCNVRTTWRLFLCIIVLYAGLHLWRLLIAENDKRPF